MKRWMLIFLFLPLASSASTVESFWHNRQALKKYGQKNFYPAYRDLLLALESDPLNPQLHLNLGRVFEANEEFDKAVQAYKSALELLPEGSKDRFHALFNLGSVYGQQKKLPEALDAYQAALEIEPESIEVKTNIELLTAQQQGGGGGEGEQDKKDENQKSKDSQDQKDQKDQNKDKPDDQQKKKQPKPFQSQELTPQDVKKILDEIKNQEQGIRAKEYEKGNREAPRGKDW